jgi:hypothetical protein
MQLTNSTVNGCHTTTLFGHSTDNAAPTLIAGKGSCHA